MIYRFLHWQATCTSALLLCDLLLGNDGVARIVDSIDAFSAHLDALVSSAPLNRVGFYGRRGAGKTTLLNKILGIEEFLPTGENDARKAVEVQ